MEGVLGTRYQNGQFQIIIGDKVDDVFIHVADILDIELDKKDIQVKTTKKSKRNIINRILDTIASSFQPILPAIIGAGMMKGILAILTVAGWVSPESGTFQILNIVSDASFYFLPFLLAVSVSRKFNVNEYLGLVLAGALMYPTIDRV